MKKFLALFALVATMSIGGTVLAAGTDVAQCAQMVMEKASCVSMCAIENQGVSDCATASSCPMTMTR